jgi:hypothetical protein
MHGKFYRFLWSRGSSMHNWKDPLEIQLQIYIPLLSRYCEFKCLVWIVFCNVVHWWLVNNSPLGTTRERYDEHSSKFSLSCETKVYRISRRKPNFRRWCLLASRQLRTIYMAPRPGLCFAPAATWNLHTTQPKTLLPIYDEVVNLTGLL